MSERVGQRQIVALAAEPRYGSNRLIGEIRMPPECFARMHVRKMDFDKWDIHRRERVAQGNAGVSECCGVEYDEPDPLSSGLMNPVDKSPFVVALERAALLSCRASGRCEATIDPGQRLTAVDLRLTAAEKVQVGAM